MRVTVLTCLLLLATAVPAVADDDVRVRGTCGSGASSELRLKPDGGKIRVEFRVRARRAGRWRVVLVHERRVVWRGRARRHSRNSYRVRREIANWSGADEVRVRATGRRGNTCAAAATVAGS